jgi:hypothetical protein
VVFCVWLCSLCTMFSRFIHVECNVSISLYVLLNTILLYGYETICSCIHQWMDVWVVFTLGLVFFFWHYWGLNSGLWACWVGTAPLEPHLLTLCFSCFSNRVLCFCPGWPGPQSYLCLLGSWNDRYVLPWTTYWLRCGLSNFLPGLTSNFDPPHLPSYVA